MLKMCVVVGVLLPVFIKKNTPPLIVTGHFSIR